MNDSSLSGSEQYTGYCADLAKMIAEHVRFTYEIKPVSDGKYGYKENNEWNGIVGELVRRVSVCFLQASLIITALTSAAGCAVGGPATIPGCGGSVVQWFGRWTCDSMVVSSIPGRRTIGLLVLGWVTVFGRTYHLGM